MVYQTVEDWTTFCLVDLNLSRPEPREALPNKQLTGTEERRTPSTQLCSMPNGLGANSDGKPTFAAWRQLSQ